MNKNILVIDDERGYREFYRYLLEPLGYSVELAEDGQEGYEMALKHSYDLILLDVHMPKMTGPEVLKRIKEARPNQPVIIFTSSSDPSYAFESKAKELGAMDCLYKPVELEELLKMIAHVIKKGAGSND